MDPAKAQSRVGAADKAETMRILAVDDDENIRELLSQALDSTGDHQVWTAEGGEEALEMIEFADEPFECLLLDIQMPGMNGIELCAEVRGLSGYRMTPIVMLTAMSQKKYIDRAFAAGATDYVTKPFDFLELFSRLNIAEKLVSEQAMVNDGILEVAEMKHDLDANLKHDLEEPVQLQDIERLVGYVAFENYLMQLGRGKLFRSSVFAVKIDKVDRAHKAASPLEFRQLLTGVATAISDCTSQDGNLFSYRGNGVFLCVVHGQCPFTQEEFEATVNHRLSATQLICVDGAKTRLVTSDLVSLRSLTKSGALHSLRDAIDKVEARLIEEDEVRDAMNRAVDANGRSPSREMEKHVYEELLRDALVEETSNTNALFNRFARRKANA
jgi:CheY-like chemotaxis protein